MHIALIPRSNRFLGRRPRFAVFGIVELALLSLLALQCARLFWTLVAPVDPVGEWEAGRASALEGSASSNVLAEFDPFFRLSAANGPVAVTSLDLVLFGTREDRASGRGSAIIGSPDGQQKSYSVGEEILPGVRLEAVGFDNVMISRNGSREQLFLDQSAPATTFGGADAAGPSAAPLPAAPSGGSQAAPAAPVGAVSADGQLRQRIVNGRPRGVTFTGNDERLLNLGLRPGDVILSVNGTPFNSSSDIAAIIGQLGGRDSVIQIERNGTVTSVRIGGSQ